MNVSSIIKNSIFFTSQHQIVRQEFLTHCARLLVSALIFFVGCSPETDTSDSNFPEKDRPKTRQTASFATTQVFFDGDPCGGQLEIFVFNTTVPIRTSPKDSITRVAIRIADAINRNISLQKQAVKGKAEDSKLILTNVQEYDVWICTTDKGINVPAKPMDLVCSVEPDDHIVVFGWNNPNGGYDRIHIVGGGIPIAEGLPGSATRFEYDYSNARGYVYEGKHIFRVVGVKRGTPSCPAVCEVFLKLP